MAAVLEQEVAAEWGYEVRLLALADLFADNSYQRPVQEQFVEKIAQTFDERLVGTLDVSLRSNGLFAIMDGLQRKEAMAIVGKETCYCSIYVGMSKREEAQFFYHKNKDRKTMHPFYGYRARLVAGDKTIQAINKTAEAAGFKVDFRTMDDGKIGSVASLEETWNLVSEHRPECLTPTLATMKDAWFGRRQSTSADLIRGLGRFFQHYGDEEIDYAHLVDKLKSLDPRDVKAQARDRMWTRSTASLGMNVAKVIVEQYNSGGVKRLSKTRLS